MNIFEYGKKKSEIVLIQPVDEHEIDMIEAVMSRIRKRTDRDFLLAAFKVNDWNKDLSPWRAPAVFGKDDFGDGAQDTLEEIMMYCEDNSKTYMIGGYSLAGLFSLWAGYKTGLFKAVAAVSPSMWFPGFDEFMKENKIMCNNVYLSLGNKEEKAKNPVMATVGDRILSAENLLKERGVNCVLEWNEGNHFRDADLRIAKGFSWILEQGL
ncbi:MAG: esterase [Butyrivibrio sp.]|nr:esterase [Butyrivibrio sp.]